MAHIIDVTRKSAPVLVRGGHYLTQPRKPWLVNGIIREGSTVFISGKEGTGKSFVGLELLSCVAEGRDFFGNKVSQGEVIYVAAERGEDQRERLEALRDVKGVNPDNIHFFDYQFKFNKPEDEQLFIDSVDASGVNPKLILIDTLRASFEGEENSSAVAQSVMDAFARCKRKFNATVVVLHHVNAFGQSRGSSAFIGAADTELYVTNSRSTGRIFLTVRKQNNGKTWTKLVLKPQEMDFGNDYSSIVLNLESEEQIDEKPEFDDEDVTRDNNIVTVLDSIGEKVSLYRIQKELSKIEGKMRNKEAIKNDAKRLAKDGLITFEQTGDKFIFGPAEVEN